MAQKGWVKVWENIKWKGSAMERPEFKLSYVILSVVFFLMIISVHPLSLKNPFNYKQIQIMVVILDYCIFYNTQIIEFIVRRHFSLHSFFPSTHSGPLVKMSSSVSMANKSVLIPHFLKSYICASHSTYLHLRIKCENKYMTICENEVKEL